jgi:hypothetical protein
MHIVKIVDDQGEWSVLVHTLLKASHAESFLVRVVGAGLEQAHILNLSTIA